MADLFGRRWSQLISTSTFLVRLRLWTAARLAVWTLGLRLFMSGRASSSQQHTHSLTHSLKHSSCLDKLPPHNTLTHSTFTPTDNKTSSHSQQLHCYCSRHLLHKIYHLSVTYFYVISQYNLGYKYISIIPDTYIIILIHVSSSIEVQEIHYWEKSITLVIESVDCDWLSVLPLLWVSTTGD